ncbi:radical SAM/SPASM protein FxsBH, inactivated beta-hydroxylase extension form, partial [Streptomyces sp. NPDC054841]
IDLPVHVPYDDGVLLLPTLGELRLTGEETRGTAQVQPVEKGFLVRSARGERRVARLDEPGVGWQPVRRLGRDGAPDLAIDDLDPYRHCFGSPALPRLGLDEAAGWTGRLARAWVLLRERVPEQATAAAGSLTTLTPVDGPGPSVGRHGFGGLGIPARGSARELAPALLRGYRRARYQALVEVTDLHAEDGLWRHPAPWQEAPVPVSQLLAGAYERAGLAAFEPGSAEEALRALDTLDRAPELTLAGKCLLAQLREEADRDR